MRVLAITNFYPTRQNPACGTFIEQQIGSLRALGLEVELMFLDRAHEGVAVYLGLGDKVRARLSRFEADLVHVMYGGVMAAQVTRSVQDRPTLVSFCGSDLLGENASGAFRKVASRIGVVASIHAARRASGIIVKSKNLLPLLPNEVKVAKIRVIPNGVDLKRFTPLDREVCRRHLGWSSDRFHVLFPANVGDPVKRPQLARAAVEELNRREIQTDLHALRGIKHEQVPIWLNASDVLLLTSSHEGSPNIVKEALACHVPVVSVDVGDIRERIEAIEGCYLAEATRCDLASKLALVFNSPRRLRDPIGIEDLALDRVAMRLSDFYEELMRSWCARFVKGGRRSSDLTPVVQ
ncbi:MAG TPA: glycosyltransferase [Candidatus Binatia bacterium]|jgi:glycosyltransferase involved in cell wall biosynthesis|nr:glycosyltransferase [Candidatus Binatia bacterium]